MATITHDDLAVRILDELQAVMGPLTSSHLCRNLDAGDILDAIHVATDDMVDGITIQD